MKEWIGKSAVLAHSACAKRAWLGIRQPRLASEPDASQQLWLQEGRKVGLAAREEFPNGVLVAGVGLSNAAVARTRDLMRAGTDVLFEAAVVAGRAGVRIDILRRLPGGRWQIIEVKASKELKEEYDADLAVQYHVCRTAKLNATRASLWLLDEKARWNRGRAFREVDRTATVKRSRPAVQRAFRAIVNDLGHEAPPPVEIGPQCLSPNDCSFKAHCWKSARVPKHSVLELPGMKSDKKWTLYRAGIRRAIDLPDEDLNAERRRLIESLRAGVVIADRSALRRELSTWSFPHYHLDFEAIAPALPSFAGLGPYGVVPVQFSLLVDDGREPFEPAAKSDYLHRDASDPRGPLARLLTEVIPSDGGTVVAYNAAFERGVLRSLAKRLANLRTPLLAIAQRLRDPLPLVRRYVYHPSFEGKFTLKRVGQALLGDSADYRRLAIRNGLMAVQKFQRMVEPDCPSDERDEIQAQLDQYCKQDTRVMCEVLRWMLKETE